MGALKRTQPIITLYSHIHLLTHIIGPYEVDFILAVNYAKETEQSLFTSDEREKKQVADPRSAMDIKPGYRGRAFTSDLSGQEFWLVVDKGFQPMGLVMGNCIYSMGAVRNWLVGVKGNFQGELKEYSQLMYQARELALSRMQFEADQLGADGVIGVDIKVEFMHNNEWMEVTAIGMTVSSWYIGHYSLSLALA